MKREEFLNFTVYGMPAPQGSKRHVGHGVMIESSKKVKPWREAVKWAGLMACKGMPDSDPRCITGPISVDMTFTMPRPKSAKIGAKADRRPDLSKLIRSTEDALTDIGAWEDDARVVECLARKVYVGDIWPGHPEWDGLTTPGAKIRIRRAS